MLKLERLVLAMAEHEGWYNVGDSKNLNGSLSYRNHNPLNLRKSPFEVAQNASFSVFRTDEDGFAAARWDILQKAKGQTVTGLNGWSTLRDLVRVWAPASAGNNPEAYLKHVCQMTGFAETMQLREFLK